MINRAYSLAQFWDGRAATLEEQAKGPMANPIEMGMTHDAGGTAPGHRGIPGRCSRKCSARDEIDIDRMAKAIASFERTVLCGNAPYDRYKSGDKSAMTAAQVRGMAVFFDKAKCDQCHEGANFTLNAYANLGVGTDKPEPDVGRFAVTQESERLGRFQNADTARDRAHRAVYARRQFEDAGRSGGPLR